MSQMIALDTHKRYSLARVEMLDGKLVAEERIEHRLGAISEFLSRFEPGSLVAFETSGNWYWIADEIEEAGMIPRLTHARKAKARIAETNSSDRITVRGLNMLQHTNRLPTVWMPPGEIRDLRELTRTRMFFSSTRTRFKNRVHSELMKHGLTVEASDIFGPRIRPELMERIATLPKYAAFATREQLDYVDHLSEQVDLFEAEIAEVFAECEETKLLKSLPGVGPTLSVVVWLEVGTVHRFDSAGSLASYAGTTGRLIQSGNRRVIGRVRRDVNRYLKWAFVEAANAVCLNQKRWSERYVVGLYRQVRDKRDHPKAIVAAARHLAESTYWMLEKREPYRERGVRDSSRGA
jgi:transposase